MDPVKAPLSFYIEKLRNGEHFSLARFGDGELYCMWGKQGKNSNGCFYTPELRQALLDSMRHENDPTFIYGLQRVLPHDQNRVVAQYPNVKWYDSEIFSEVVAAGNLYPLIEQLRTMKVIIITNFDAAKGFATAMGAGYHFGFIEVPKSNSFEKRDEVLKLIKENEAKDAVVLFSCGMAANAFIAELHGKFDGWLIDLGHIWDPFTGLMSRCDLEGKTMDDINKNLHAPTP